MRKTSCRISQKLIWVITTFLLSLTLLPMAAMAEEGDPPPDPIVAFASDVTLSGTVRITGTAQLPTLADRTFAFEIQDASGTAVAKGSTVVTGKNTATTINFTDMSDAALGTPSNPWTNVLADGATYTLVETTLHGYVVTIQQTGKTTDPEEFTVNYSAANPTFVFSVTNEKNSGLTVSGTKTVTGTAPLPTSAADRTFAFEIQDASGVAVAKGSATVTGKNTAATINFTDMSDAALGTPSNPWTNVLADGEIYTLVETTHHGYAVTIRQAGKTTDPEEFTVDYGAANPTFVFSVANEKNTNLALSGTKTVTGTAPLPTSSADRTFAFEIQDASGAAVAKGSATVTVKNTAETINFTDMSDVALGTPTNPWTNVLADGATYTLVETTHHGYVVTIQQIGKTTDPEEFTVNYSAANPTFTFSVTNEKNTDIYQEYTDPATGVKVSGVFVPSYLPSGLVVVPIPVTDPVYTGLLVNGKEVVVAYEVYFTGSYTLAPGAKLTISFPVDAALNGQSILVRHQLAGGSIEDFTAVAANGSVSVVVDSLSPFMLLKASGSTPPPGGSTSGSAPSTGDETSLALWLALTVIAGGALAFLWLRGRKRRTV